jgi:hypothetical protein
MPTWSEILTEVQVAFQQRGPGHPIFDEIRRKYLTALQLHNGRNLILYASKWTQGGQVDARSVSTTDEDMQGLMEVVHKLPGEPLDLILHSPGDPRKLFKWL